MMEQAMLPTYKAILRGNRLEWRGSGRQYLPTDRPVAVYVTVLDEPLGEVDGGEKGQGARMAASLERLAEIHALADIGAPPPGNARGVKSELCQVETHDVD